MRKSSIIIACALIALLTSCIRHYEDVKPGMTTAQMKELIGRPDSIRNDYFAEVWFYETHVVSISCDTVTMIRSKAEIRAEMREMQKEIERLREMGY